MDYIETLKGKYNALVNDARSLVELAKTENRTMAAEEVEKYDRVMQDVRDMKATIQREEEVREMEIKEAKKTDPEKDKAEWRSLGEFVQAVVHNPSDKRLRGREDETRQQSQSVDIEGGFLVPNVFSSELLTVSPDEAIIRPRATTFGGATGVNFGELHIPALQYAGNNMYAGAAVNWIDEGADKPETDVQFRRVTLHPFEVAAHVEITDRLLSNASMIGQIVSNQLRGALIDAEEDAFLNDTAAGTPTGIIDHPATIQVARDGAGVVIYQDLADMLAVFWGRRGVWITGRDTLPELMALIDGNGNMVWQPNARDGNPGTIFGMPVLFSDHSPAMAANGGVVLADLSYYVIGDGQGISIASSPHMRFTSNRTIIKAWKTVDGTPWLDGPLPTTVATSPFVQLQG